MREAYLLRLAHALPLLQSSREPFSWHRSPRRHAAPTVRVDYNQPFDELLSRLVPANVHHDLPAEKRGHNEIARWTKPAGDDDKSIHTPLGQGCPPEYLVELRGIEPRSSSAVLDILRVQYAVSFSQSRRLHAHIADRLS